MVIESRYDDESSDTLKSKDLTLEDVRCRKILNIFENFYVWLKFINICVEFIFK